MADAFTVACCLSPLNFKLAGWVTTWLGFKINYIVRIVDTYIPKVDLIILTELLIILTELRRTQINSWVKSKRHLWQPPLPIRQL